MQRCIRGLRGGHVYKDDIGQYVRVPIPDPAFLTRFEEISDIAEQKRNAGKRLIREAIRHTQAFASSVAA